MPRRRLTRTTYRLHYRRGRWWVDYTDPATGRTRSASSGLTDETNQEAALIWRDQFVIEQERPELPPVPLIEAILEGYKASRIEKIQAPATLTYAIKAIVRHVGNLEPDQLGAGTYMKLRAAEGVKDGTIRRETGVLRAALQWAKKEKWLQEPPILDAPSVPPPRDRWLTHDEVERLIDASFLLHLKVFIVLAYHTAARKGAILDLTWDRVDFDSQLIEYERPGRQQSKKQRAAVPMNTVVLGLLQSVKELRVTDYVVEWRGQPVRSVRTAFDDACARAGIAGCSPHILRHTSATHMVMAGVPLREIARYLSTTEAIVEKVYGKHAPDYLRRAANSLAGPAGPRKVRG